MGDRGERDGQAANVAASWSRIEAWLGRHLPIQRATLRPGVSARDLARFEARVGRRLPDDVRESWRIHDGQRRAPYAPEHPGFDSDGFDGPRVQGLVYGGALLPLAEDRDGLTGRSALLEWQKWSDLLDDPDGPAEEIAERCTSFPEGAIRRLYASRGWVPLVRANAFVNLGVDLSPGPEGAEGQVINFGRDGEEKYVVAGSWARFLADVADELEAGNFRLRDDAGDPAFEMRRPRPGEFALNLRAWSESKSSGSLLRRTRHRRAAPD